MYESTCHVLEIGTSRTALRATLARASTPGLRGQIVKEPEPTAVIKQLMYCVYILAGLECQVKQKELACASHGEEEPEEVRAGVSSKCYARDPLGFARGRLFGCQRALRMTARVWVDFVLQKVRNRRGGYII